MGQTQPLTERQQAILDFIQHSIRSRGYPPTLREIGAKMGIRSTNGVSDHLRALERKGYLRREDKMSRALRPVTPGKSPTSTRPTTTNIREEWGELEERTIQIDAAAQPANEVMRVPLVGKVAAGPLTFASQNIEQQFMMDPSLLKSSGETFALRVRGNSMIDAGINEGDILFVRRQEEAKRGEIVVALVGDEATVKRFYPERDHIRLHPENKTLTDIIVRRNEMSAFKILGLVVGLFRNVAGLKSI